MCWDEPLLLTNRLLLGVALRNLEMMWRTTERQCRREVVSRGDADVENAAKGWGADFCRCGVNDGELLEGGLRRARGERLEGGLRRARREWQ